MKGSARNNVTTEDEIEAASSDITFRWISAVKKNNSHLMRERFSIMIDMNQEYSQSHFFTTAFAFPANFRSKNKLPRLTLLH